MLEEEEEEEGGGGGGEEGENNYLLHEFIRHQAISTACLLDILTVSLVAVFVTKLNK
jgi:hypothetical protein